MGLTVRQFEQMQNRLKHGARRSNPAPEESASGKAHADEIVLGIDPSLRGTGYGVIQFHRLEKNALAFGTIACPAGWQRSRCLLQIAQTLKRIIQEFKPTVCAVEGLFFAQNLQTALIMGEARGAAMVSVAEAGIEIFEIAPRKAKQAIVGFGGAQKLAVSKMVQRMLNLAELPEPDAADALALALAHAQSRSNYTITPQKKI